MRTNIEMSRGGARSAVRTHARTSSADNEWRPQGEHTTEMTIAGGDANYVNKNDSSNPETMCHLRCCCWWRARLCVRVPRPLQRDAASDRNREPRRDYAGRCLSRKRSAGVPHRHSAHHTPHGQHGPVRTLCTRTRRRTHRGHWSAGGRAGRRAEMRIMDGAYRLDYFAKRRHNSHGYLQNGRRRAHATDSRGRARVRRRAHHSGDASAACALLANAPRAKREIQTATIRHRFAHAGKTADTSCLRHLQSTISTQKLSNTMPAANVT